VMATVYIRNPTAAAVGQIVGGGTSTTNLQSNSVSVANRFGCVASGGGAFETATDVIWHGGIALFSGTTGSIVGVDRANTSGTTCGTGGFSAETLRLFRGPGGIEQMDGSIAEAMIVGPTTASATDFNNWFDNANGINGYNGTLP
jgi:hypothetical protein